MVLSKDEIAFRCSNCEEQVELQSCPKCKNEVWCPDCNYCEACDEEVGD